MRIIFIDDMPTYSDVIPRVGEYIKIGERRRIVVSVTHDVIFKDGETTQILNRTFVTTGL